MVGKIINSNITTSQIKVLVEDKIFTIDYPTDKININNIPDNYQIEHFKDVEFYKNYNDLSHETFLYTFLCDEYNFRTETQRESFKVNTKTLINQYYQKVKKELING